MQDTLITIGTKTYDRFQETPDKTTYVSDLHTVGNIDVLLLGRTVPSSIDGQAKSRVNLIQDITSGTGETLLNVGRMYASVEFSVPAKATLVQRNAILADLRAYVNSTSMEDLLHKQSI